MITKLRANSLSSPNSHPESAPRLVIGITHPQTCLILTERLCALRNAGFHVTLICSPGELLTQTAAATGIDALAIPIARTISPLADLLSLWRLWRALRQLRPLITEFSTPKAGFLGTLAARLARTPNRIYFLRGLKLETASGLKRRILLLAEKNTASSAHLVLSNSESLRTEALKLGIANPTKIKVLGDGSSTGVDLSRFSPGNSEIRQALAIPATAQVIGFAGRLTRDKGVPELVKAFKKILQTKPETHLLLVGWFDASEDALNQELIDEISAHSQIHTTGMVADTVPYYRAMDLLILPTWREGFPNVILEAAACGLPVITTLSTGARDAVLPEVTGLLIPPGHPDAIVEAALKLLKNTDKRIQMGQAARAWVKEYYSKEKVLSENIEFYRGLLSSSENILGAKNKKNHFAPQNNTTSEPLRQLR